MPGGIYYAEFCVSGGCRHNSKANAYGAAAAVQIQRKGKVRYVTTMLQPNPELPPTSSRAELMGIILALEMAVRLAKQLRKDRVKAVFTIMSDSTYAINAMSTWVHEWKKNGWKKTRGALVANHDLLHKALLLQRQIERRAQVTYMYVSRLKNPTATWHVNDMIKVYKEGYDCDVDIGHSYVIKPDRAEALGIVMEELDLGKAGNEDAWEDVVDEAVDVIEEETKELIAEVMAQR